MAELHDLSPSDGSRREQKRRARARPEMARQQVVVKGQNSIRRKHTSAFEGGRCHSYAEFPEGFKSLNRVEYQVVNLRDLQS